MSLRMHQIILHVMDKNKPLVLVLSIYLDYPFGASGFCKR
jgi:hypothetical protein